MKIFLVLCLMFAIAMFILRLENKQEKRQAIREKFLTGDYYYVENH